MNYTAFDPGRISRHGRFGRLLFQAKDNGTLLRDRHWSQISRINDIVMNTSIEYKGQVRTTFLWKAVTVDLAKTVPAVTHLFPKFNYCMN